MSSGARATVAGAVVGFVVGAALVVVAIVHIVRDVVHTVNAPSVALPADLQRNLSPADYDIYQRTGTRTGGNGFTFGQNQPVTLSPTDVRVTDPNGVPVPLRVPGATETISHGGAVYTAAVRFTATSSGVYDIRIERPGIGVGSASDADEVVVAKSLGSVARSAVRWVLLAIVGGMLGLGAIVLFIIVFVRSRRQRSPVAAAPAYAAAPAAAPPGWYPDPSGQAAHRWWDGMRWTDHTG